MKIFEVQWKSHYSSGCFYIRANDEVDAQEKALKLNINNGKLELSDIKKIVQVRNLLSCY